MTEPARTIPFTKEQRATILATALLMLPVGLFMLVTGVIGLSQSYPVAAMVPAWPFIINTISDAVEVVLGLGLLAASVAFAMVSRQGTIAALVRGLRALCVVYVIKAVLLLLAVAVGLFVFLGMPMFMK